MSGTQLDFEQVFKLQFPVLCNVAFNIIKNKKAAEDIVQDVFIKLWQNWQRLETVENYKGYLYRSTTNASIDHLRQNKNVVPFNFMHHEFNSDTVTAERQMMKRELELKIEKALNDLPPKCRAIFVLSRHEGLKYKEIAEYLQISMKTVENQMGIALGKLRRDLEPYLTKEFMLHKHTTVVE